MTTIVILSAGGTARELCELIASDFEVIGFLDDFRQGDRVIGKLESAQSFVDSGAKLISALGSYRSMRRRHELLDAMPLEAFIGHRDTRAVVYDSAVLERASTVFPLSVVAAGACVGVHAFVYHNCVISHDADVGAFSILSNSVTVSGGVVIGQNSYIGAGATVMEGCTIGDNAIVAAGATVISDVPDNCIYLSRDRIKPNHYLEHL